MPRTESKESELGVRLIMAHSVKCQHQQKEIISPSPFVPWYSTGELVSRDGCGRRSPNAGHDNWQRFICALNGEEVCRAEALVRVDRIAELCDSLLAKLALSKA